jgi:hypothetical protein
MSRQDVPVTAVVFGIAVSGWVVSGVGWMRMTVPGSLGALLVKLAQRRAGAVWRPVPQ